MHRLFVAIDLPRSVKDMLRALCTGVSGAKWVSDQQMHLTLRFIGAADDDEFMRIRNSLKDVRRPPFNMEINGVGCFPGERRARILWAGLKADHTLFDLQNDIEKALVREGLLPDDRHFSPHITLARMKVPNPRDVSRFRSSNEAFACPPFEVREFYLYSSILSPKGPSYTKEMTYPLAPTAGPGTL